MSNTVTKRPGKKTSGLTEASAKLRRSDLKAPGGVVNFCVHGHTVKTPALYLSPSMLIEALRVGLPVRELDDLQARLALPMEKLAPMLGISKATLHRRRAGGRLGQAESERVVRIAKLLGKAAEVLESEEKARQWLAAPQFGLGGAVPLEYAGTEVGAREVEDLLGRIEHGVYT